jgi:hypothetical protein
MPFIVLFGVLCILRRDEVRHAELLKIVSLIASFVIMPSFCGAVLGAAVKIVWDALTRLSDLS